MNCAICGGPVRIINEKLREDIDGMRFRCVEEGVRFRDWELLK